jgi:hypothetical protein
MLAKSNVVSTEKSTSSVALVPTVNTPNNILAKKKT